MKPVEPSESKSCRMLDARRNCRTRLVLVLYIIVLVVVIDMSWIQLLLT